MDVQDFRLLTISMPGPTIAFSSMRAAHGRTIYARARQQFCFRKGHTFSYLRSRMGLAGTVAWPVACRDSHRRGSPGSGICASSLVEISNAIS